MWNYFASRLLSWKIFQVGASRKFPKLRVLYFEGEPCQRQLTRSICFVHHPASPSCRIWSPDGKYIVFMSFRDGVSLGVPDETRTAANKSV